MTPEEKEEIKFLIKKGNVVIIVLLIFFAIATIINLLIFN
jgi:hypothetical protein